MKGSHKLKALGDVAAVVASAPNLTAAAQRLGVNRSTLHRWLGCGKVARPGRPNRATGGRPAAGGPRPGQTPEQWRRCVLREFRLDATEQQLLDLAVQALGMAHDVTQPGPVRLAAMARVQAIVRQLALPAEQEAAHDGDSTTDDGAEIRAFPRRAG